MCQQLNFIKGRYEVFSNNIIIIFLSRGLFYIYYLIIKL